MLQEYEVECPVCHNRMYDVCESCGSLYTPTTEEEEVFEDE